jgi:hypothetical protein
MAAYWHDRVFNCRGFLSVSRVWIVRERSLEAMLDPRPAALRTTAVSSGNCWPEPGVKLVWDEDAWDDYGGRDHPRRA